MSIFFDVVVLVVLMWLTTKVLTIEKYLKNTQTHLATLFQNEIDKLLKEKT